jgi:hypothetical protein
VFRVENCGNSESERARGHQALGLKIKRWKEGKKEGKRQKVAVEQILVPVWTVNRVSRLGIDAHYGR